MINYKKLGESYAIAERLLQKKILPEDQVLDDPIGSFKTIIIQAKLDELESYFIDFLIENSGFSTYMNLYSVKLTDAEKADWIFGYENGLRVVIGKRG